jgi:ACS family glucarate transporter-like MFS transporter
MGLVTPTPQQKPSRARHIVVLFAVTLAIITYIDRTAISKAAPLIQRDFGLTSKLELGIIFSAFGWAYALFEIPGGWMGDWLGPRRVLLRVVAWWSVCVAALGSMWNVTSMAVMNFLFGAGEAGCFPNLTKVFTIWLPQNERVRAQGILWMSARWGGAFTPLIVGWLLSMFTWRQTFRFFGVLGVIWAVLFYRWFRDNPREHPSVNEAERALLEDAHKGGGHGNVPWRKLAGSLSVWLLWVQYFCLSYTFWFYVFWLPDYLKEARHLTGAYADWLNSFPLLFGGIGCIVGGLLAARVARLLGSVRWGRKAMACFGCLGAAVLMFTHVHVGSAFWAMFLLGLASFSNDLVMPNAWGACMDIGGRYAGTLSGSMNMMGNLAGGVAPAVTGYILDATHGNWVIGIYVMAAIYLVGAVSWLFIDPVTPLESRA